MIDLSRLVIICNLCILYIMSDGIHEIPLVKKTLQENMKKAWTYYSKKLLFQCIKYHKTGIWCNILTVDSNLRLLSTCLDIQRNEVLLRAKGKLR